MWITPIQLQNTNFKMWDFLQSFTSKKLGQSTVVNQVVCPLLQEAALQSVRKEEAKACKLVKLLKMRNWEFMAIFLLSGQKNLMLSTQKLYHLFHYNAAQIYQYKL